MKRIITIGAILLGSLVSFNTTAQMSEEDAENAVKTRQSVFRMLSFSNGPLGAMARGQAEFDRETAIQAAERVAYLAEFIPEIIRATDTRGTDVETRAFDSMWENLGEVDQLAMDLRDGAMAAIEILNNQGASGVRQAVMEIGPKCGACHDRFRAD